MSHTDQTNRPGRPDRQGVGAGPSPDRRGVSPDLQRQIDENLRRLYGQPSDEALPEQLQMLVQRLRARDDAR